MTKSQLLAALEPYDDDTQVVVASLIGASRKRGFFNAGASLDPLAPRVCPNGDAVQLMTTEFAALLEGE